MGLGLTIQFIAHLYTQLVTTSNCSAIANLHSAIHHSTCLSHLSLLYLHQFSGNGFQQWMFPFLWVPKLSLCLSSQTQLQQSCNSLTHQLILPITSQHRSHRKHRSSLAVPLLCAQPSLQTVQRTPFLYCCLWAIT
jgi:hypothetical protein